MGKQENHSALLTKLKLRWYMILRSILGLWVKPRIQADADGNIGVSKERPVCYIMDSYALSSVLILDKCCEQQNLARPLLAIPAIPESGERSYAVLKRLRGLFFRSPDPRSHSKMLQQVRCRSLSWSVKDPAKMPD